VRIDDATAYEPNALVLLRHKRFGE
jgi:hypothetical protein